MRRFFCVLEQKAGIYSTARQINYKNKNTLQSRPKSICKIFILNFIIIKTMTYIELSHLPEFRLELYPKQCRLN